MSTISKRPLAPLMALSIAFFTGCGTAKIPLQESVTPAVLTQKVWQWYGLKPKKEEGIQESWSEIPDSSRYTLEFLAEGRVALQADCNRALGIYKLESQTNKLKLEIGPVTRAFCPPPSRSNEFIRLLQGADVIKQEGESLQITLEEGSELLFKVATP